MNAKVRYAVSCIFLLFTDVTRTIQNISVNLRSGSARFGRVIMLFSSSDPERSANAFCKYRFFGAAFKQTNLWVLLEYKDMKI